MPPRCRGRRLSPAPGEIVGYALLFAGQGGQRPDMLGWLEREPACAALLAGLGDILGPDWRDRLVDRDWAVRSAVAQPLIVGTALAAWAAVAARLEQAPACVAGYSVGELSACAAAGALTPEVALELAVRRAQLMDDAVRGVSTGLLSISRATESEVLWRCPGVEVAIRIAPDHALYAGRSEALAAAEAALGGRADCKILDVALASHSSYMRAAAGAFAQALSHVSFRPPVCPVVTHSAEVVTRDPRALADSLSRQLDHVVEWEGCMVALAERRVDCVLEIGPGQALARMWAARHPGIPVRSIEDFRDHDGAAAWVSRFAHRA